jgi:hypothetical protein
MAKKPATDKHSETQAFDDAALDGVAGGTAAGGEVAKEVISPRDSASGLPSGQRIHKPFTAT